jgi:DNA mismatch endonuclease (patch repair protein)
MSGRSMRPMPSQAIPTSATVSRIMRANRKSNTRPELALRSALHRLGRRFRVGMQVKTDRLRVRPDIVFTRARVTVFVDGCFWHQCPDHGTSPKTNRDYWLPKLRANIARDRRIDAALTDAGWEVVHVWEHEAPELAASRIGGLLERRYTLSSRPPSQSV